MIQLDDNHWVQSASDVRVIRPTFKRSPDDTGLGYKAAVAKDRCAALIGGDWVTIDRGVMEIASILQAATEPGPAVIGGLYEHGRGL